LQITQPLYTILTPTLLLLLFYTNSHSSHLNHFRTPASHAPKIDLITSLPTLIALLSLLISNTLYEILACSIVATLTISIILAFTATLDYLLSKLDIEDKDVPITPDLLEFLLNDDMLVAFCIGPNFGIGYKDLGIQDWGFESLCRIGGLVVVVVPKGFIERRIVCRVLRQGREWLDGWEGYTKNGGLGGVADGKIEMATENKTLAEV
jgi:hypothetical protein